MLEVDEHLNRLGRLSSIIDTDGKFILYSTSEMDELGAVSESPQEIPPNRLKPGEIFYAEVSSVDKIVGIKTPLTFRPPLSGILFQNKLEEALQTAIDKARRRLLQLIDSPGPAKFPAKQSCNLNALRTRRPVSLQELQNLQEHAILYRTRTKNLLIEAVFILTKDTRALARKTEHLGRTISLHSLSELYLEMLDKMKLNVYHMIHMTLANRFPLRDVNTARTPIQESHTI